VRTGLARPEGAIVALARVAALALVTSFGFGLVPGCRADSGELERGSEPGTSGAASGTTAVGSGPGGGPHFGVDPFAGVEALRPQAWTGWPLENVAIETEAGWRVDPVSGGLVLESGLVFAAEPSAFVLAIAPGEVVELRPLDSPSGAVELVLAHGDGIESRYAPLTDALVHAGLPVERGSALGLAGGRSLRLELRVDGVAIDPLLVLRQPLHRWPAAIRERPRPPAADG
jgi:murein DD-endopeptidase MepM/ murein hydrolase activator NlpD